MTCAVSPVSSSTTISQYQFGKSYGATAQNVQDLGTSVFQQPHRVVFSTTYTFPNTGTDISVQYTGESGQRFHYTYGGTSSGDMNGDGIGNDLLYIPTNVRDSSQIIFATLSPELRAAYGFELTPARRAAMRATLRTMKMTRPFLPARYRYIAPYWEWLLRQQGKEPPGIVDDAMRSVGIRLPAKDATP